MLRPFLVLVYPPAKLTRIAYRNRPREAVHMFNSIEHPFECHTERRLVDHTQDEMTLEYLSESFETLIEPVLFRVGVEPSKRSEAVVSLSLIVTMKRKMSSQYCQDAIGRPRSLLDDRSTRPM